MQDGSGQAFFDFVIGKAQMIDVFMVKQDLFSFNCQIAGLEKQGFRFYEINVKTSLPKSSSPATRFSRLGMNIFFSANSRIRKLGVSVSNQ